MKLKLVLSAALCAATLAAAPSANAACPELVSNGGFEANNPGGWFFTGNAGIDYGLGFATQGYNNGWVRNYSGWNAINKWVPVNKNTKYWITAVIKTNITNNTSAYFSVRDQNVNAILAEQVVQKTPCGAQKYTFSFNSGNNTSVLIYAGLWGNGSDQWLQIDEVSIQPDSCANPIGQICYY